MLKQLTRILTWFATYLLLTLGVANTYYMLGPLRRLYKCFSGGNSHNLKQLP